MSAQRKDRSGRSLDDVPKPTDQMLSYLLCTGLVRALADTNQQAGRPICARSCARDAAGHAETGGIQKAWDNFVP
jgi:hypothetical protein